MGLADNLNNSEGGSRAAIQPVALVKALRPHQWIKNSLLIVPLVLAHQPVSQQNLLQLLFAFISFSGVASAMYLVNDICLLYTSPSPRDATLSRMPSSA